MTNTNEILIDTKSDTVVLSRETLTGLIATCAEVLGIDEATAASLSSKTQVLLLDGVFLSDPDFTLRGLHYRPKTPGRHRRSASINADNRVVLELDLPEFGFFSFPYEESEPSLEAAMVKARRWVAEAPDLGEAPIRMDTSSCSVLDTAITNSPTPRTNWAFWDWCEQLCRFASHEPRYARPKDDGTWRTWRRNERGQEEIVSSSCSREDAEAYVRAAPAR